MNLSNSPSSASAGPIEWHGEGISETGVDKANGQTLIEIDPRYFRPTEVDHLLGDAGKAREKLGWEHSTPFRTLVNEMIDADRAALKENG